MNDTQKESWHLSKSIPISIIIVIIGQTFFSGWQLATLNAQVQSNTTAILEHAQNSNLHMTYQDKMTTFVPRLEMDSRLNSIEKTLDEIKKEVKSK